MALFKRKREEKNIELPELPNLPEFPPISSISQNKDLNFYEKDFEKRDRDLELSPLPSFKENDKLKEEVTKTIIKEDINDTNKKFIKEDIEEENLEKSFYNYDKEEKEELEVIKPQIKAPLIKEIDKKFEKDFEKEDLKEIKINNKTSNEKKGPLFIRIDKYKNAIEKIQDVKQQLMEIEKMLRDIKELKEKEEFEIIEWEKEIQSAKSKIDSIDKLLFSELEE
ncbi:MAG: hypothetical protein QW117_00595 [Candidatus Pacearchaeota archaeon]